MSCIVEKEEWGFHYLSGTTIDQGIAYVLMLVALVLTYLIHPLDAASNFVWFKIRNGKEKREWLSSSDSV